MTGAFLAGLVAGYGVAIPVGAIAILILGLSARTSFRVGAAAALGVASADGLYAALAALGGAAVASGLAPFAG
ncbi:lysine transporter LysE, partial [Micromonospora aurantiaca]